MSNKKENLIRVQQRRVKFTQENNLLLAEEKRLQILIRQSSQHSSYGTIKYMETVLQSNQDRQRMLVEILEVMQEYELLLYNDSAEYF